MAKKIVALVHEKYEELELWYPVLRLREEGFIVDIAGEKSGAIYNAKWGYPAKADKSFEEIDCSQYGGLIVPGGYAPDKLRRYKSVLDIVKNMNQDKKIIGHICHAASVLISAGILKNRKVTSFHSIKDDVINAGAEWINLGTVIDGNIVSAQTPDDLPEFMKQFIKSFK